MSALIKVARVSGAFGVKGEVRVTAYTEAPETLLGFKTLLRADGSPGLALQSGRAHKGVLIARVAEITTPEQADALRGLELYVLRAALPDPDEDEFYLTDLIGLEVVSPGGEALGRVKSVRDFGAGDLLEVQPQGGSSWFVTFTHDNVPQVDIAAGRVVIIRPDEVSERDS